VSPLVPLPQQDSPLTAIAANLVSFHDHMLSGTLYAMYKRANPREAGRLETYWVNASEYPYVVTQTGLALRAAYQAHHQATGG
jgi:hypothetical protein